jgi:drug/metabolite transporter (DMT)-like permease
MPALLALIAVTAVWGVTFVQVKDAVALYPLFAFLALRFAIAALVLAAPAAGRIRTLGRPGWLAGAALGLLLALGYALQTAGLERTTVSSAGFITGLYVVFTPLLALALFRTRVGGAVWVGVALAVVGLAMLSGVGAGDPVGDLLVLLGSAAYSVQIVLMERYAPRYDPVAFTQVEMLAAFTGFAVVAVALGQVEVPHGRTVWGALLVTGIFASALAFLVQTWAQRRTSATRTALAFAMEPVFAGFFGFWLAGDRLGAIGWGGCALIMAGIVVAEPEGLRFEFCALRGLMPVRRLTKLVVANCGVG